MRRARSTFLNNLLLASSFHDVRKGDFKKSVIRLRSDSGKSALNYTHERIFSTANGDPAAPDRS
jgi:hypothetical protein